MCRIGTAHAESRAAHRKPTPRFRKRTRLTGKDLFTNLHHPETTEVTHMRSAVPKVAPIITSPETVERLPHPVAPIPPMPGESPPAAWDPPTSQEARTDPAGALQQELARWVAGSESDHDAASRALPPIARVATIAALSILCWIAIIAAATNLL